MGQRAVDDEGIVGLSIGIAIDGEVVFAGGFGHADAERLRAVDEDTVYDIASVGKHFTAAAVLRLVEQGKLSLDARVRNLLPEIPAHFPNATVEQLLRHTSGFVSGDLDELDPPESFRREKRGLEVLDDPGLTTGSVRFEPGRTWVYSNSGYLVLGVLVEKVAGKTYPEVILNDLLAPIGVTGMTVGDRAAGSRMSESLRRTEDGVAAVPLIHMSAYGGAGSVCSSVMDLLRWSRALNAGEVVSPESLRQMRSPSVVRGDVSTAEIPYGMAQRMGTLGGFEKVGHTGTFDGGSAVLAYYPEAALEIAVLSNTRGEGAPHAREIESRIARLLLGLEEEDTLVPVPITAEETQAIEGLYMDRATYEAKVENDEVVIESSDRELGRLLHVGDLRFRNLSRPEVEEWFLMDGDRAGWWAVAYNGFLGEVSRRVPSD